MDGPWVGCACLSDLSRIVTDMPGSLPSLDLLAAEADRERDAVLRHTDAVETKGGVVLGAAAALTALGTTSPLRVVALPASLLAALAAVGVLWPRQFPTRDLRLTRERYLASEPAFTSLMLLDSTIEMVERARRMLERKAFCLQIAAALLVLAGGAIATGTIDAAIGG